mmetsp:Transcript_29898/g.88502  ORF Transcript_29898/g.88502 Transcript_29898/m.88502 type:complete len:275 (+) Transcript_29898:809-1633(+)
MLQRRARELRVAHAAVTRHATARDTAGHHLVCTQPGQLGEGLLDAHLLGRARHVHCNLVAHLLEVQLVDQEVAHELDRLVQAEAQRGFTDLALDLRQARRRVHHNGQLAALACLQQRRLELRTLGRRRVLEATRVEHHAAAQRPHVLGHHHLVARLAKQAHQLLVHRRCLGVRCRRPHHARDTRREVHYLARQRARRRGRLGRGCRHRHLERRRPLWHVRVPHRHHVACEAVEQPRAPLKRRGADNRVHAGHEVEERRNRTVDEREVIGQPLGG